MYDAIVVGGGFAGMTAAIYLKRALRKVLVLEKDNFGGQINTSPRVENYPGFVSITGMELAEKMYEQLEAFKVENDYAEVVKIEKSKGVFVLTAADGEEYRARSVIIACGAAARKLGVEGESELIGKGVSFCASCDGAFFKGKTVVVVGGGNVALGDALYLSNLCKRVIVVHRSDSFKGAKRLEKQLRERENVEFVLNAQLAKVEGQESVHAVVISRDGKTERVRCSGVFICVGHVPEAGFLEDMVERGARGHIITKDEVETKTPGLFVAGDVRQKDLRQLTTAVSDGSLAATRANEYLDAADA